MLCPRLLLGVDVPGLRPGSLPGPVEHQQAWNPFQYKQGLVYLEIISGDCPMCLSACSEIKVREVGH